MPPSVVGAPVHPSDARAYPIGAREAERLRAVDDLRIIGTAPDPTIDRVTELARRLLGMPISVVTILGESQQWFKSRCGIAEKGIPRELAVCNRTILSDEVFVVEDAERSPHYAQNPLVTGPPHLRFYAGAPLVLSPGIRVGTLCIMDIRPRRLSASGRALLLDLAALVTGQIQLHERNNVILQQTQALSRQQALLAQTERLANLGGWEFDPRRDEQRWSDNLLRLYDLPAGAPTPSLDEAYAPYDPSDRVTLQTSAAELIDGRRAEFDHEMPFTTPRGATLTVRTYGAAELRDGQPVLFGYVQDITERKLAEQRLLWIGHHDDLTKLPNRVSFKQGLEQSLAESAAAGRRLGLLLIDVDHFKEVNDTLGHDAGDALLCRVAERLLAGAAAPTAVARLGGDEFAILLPAIEGRDEAAAMAASIMRRLREPASWGGREISCCVSIGLALSPDDDTTATELMKDADVALDAAKRGGRNQCLAYVPAMRAALQRRVSVLRRARDALALDGILPFYQPKVDLLTGTLVGFEALLRWHHPSEPGVVLSPAAIAEAFEDPELSVELGQRMLDKVIADMGLWRARDLTFGSVALNVAGPEFCGPVDYADNVAAKLAIAGIPPGCLQIEVTETVFLGEEAEKVRASLIALDERGIAVALDDFGTGYASLTHLRQFPVTWLKIDRSFVSGLEADPDAAAIAEAVIKLGQSLGIRVVAEGVETPDQALFLRERGCELGQGYYFGKPMSGALVPDFIAHWHGPRYATSAPLARVA